ncbi:MAG: hypothetical protein DDT26_02113 [Dehalococcoidia bacterium]|nr:hypothetical protein [Chloroflexota bacterium]
MDQWDKTNDPRKAAIPIALSVIPTGILIWKERKQRVILPEYREQNLLPAVTAKHPWQMTREQFEGTTTAKLLGEDEPGWGPRFDISDWTDLEIKEAERLEDVFVYTPKEGTMYIEFSKQYPTASAISDLSKISRPDVGEHKRLLLQAIAEGRPIPPEVWDDYPDLRLLPAVTRPDDAAPELTADMPHHILERNLELRHPKWDIDLYGWEGESVTAEAQPKGASSREGRITKHGKWFYEVAKALDGAISSPGLLPAVKEYGRIDWMPRKKVWRVIWYKNGDVAMGDFPTREEASARLRELIDKRHSNPRVNPAVITEEWYRNRWDGDKLGRRAQLVMEAGWITGEGRLTKLGEKITPSKWDELSPAAQAVLRRKLEKLYSKSVTGELSPAEDLMAKTTPPRKKEPWEAIDDEMNKRIIIAHARPADVEAALRYYDRVAVGERLLLAYQLAGKHRLPQEYELKEYLKRFFPAKLDRLEMEEEEEEEEENEEEENDEEEKDDEMKEPIGRTIIKPVPKPTLDPAVAKAKVIPLHPPPRGQARLEFLADSPQHLAQTIDAIGYRSQIDNTFQEAIARAKGLKS